MMDKIGDTENTLKPIEFTLGVKCMEQNVLEIDEAVRDFLIASTNSIPLTISSWKFPHLKIEKVDIEDIIGNLKSQDLPTDVHYLNLVELLIDRLYFSYLSIIRFVSTVSSVASDQGSIQSTCAVGNGDWSSDFFGLTVVNPLCSSDPKLVNTNIGLVVRHLQNSLAILEANVHEVVGRVRLLESRKDGPTSPISLIGRLRKRCCVTQTELSSIENCEVCTISQEAIKKVGDILEISLSHLSPNDPTAIAHARVDISKNFFISTQWSAVMRWCDALLNDAETIGRKTQEVASRNIELDEEVKRISGILNTSNRDHQIAMQSLDKKCSLLENHLLTKKKELLESTELQKSLDVKVRESERQLSLREEEVKKIGQEKDVVRRSLATLEKSHQELKYSQSTHSETLRRIQQDLLAEQQYKETVQGNLLALEGANRKYRLEIAKLNSNISHLTKEKMDFETEVKDLRSQISQILDESRQKKNTEKENLKVELKKAQEKIELLTLYPDLNGPISLPQSENENVIEAIESQLKGNATRVQVLLQQTEKLATTLKKLKNLKTKD